MCDIRPCLVHARAGFIYLIRGVRRISRFVTGAVKVVALDTAHEGRNDCRLMLSSLWMAAAQCSATIAQTHCFLSVTEIL